MKSKLLSSIVILALIGVVACDPNTRAKKDPGAAAAEQNKTDTKTSPDSNNKANSENVKLTLKNALSENMEKLLLTYKEELSNVSDKLDNASKETVKNTIDSITKLTEAAAKSSDSAETMLALKNTILEILKTSPALASAKTDKVQGLNEKIDQIAKIETQISEESLKVNPLSGLVITLTSSIAKKSDLLKNNTPAAKAEGDTTPVADNTAAVVDLTKQATDALNVLVGRKDASTEGKTILDSLNKSLTDILAKLKEDIKAETTAEKKVVLVSQAKEAELIVANLGKLSAASAAKNPVKK